MRVRGVRGLSRASGGPLASRSLACIATVSTANYKSNARHSVLRYNRSPSAVP